MRENGGICTICKSLCGRIDRIGVIRMIDEKKLIEIIESYRGDIFASEIVELIKQMPTVAASKWIPCSERMPNKEECLKDDGRFMLDDGNRRYEGLFDIYDGKFKFGKHISGLRYELFEDNCVIAWQPLPPKYNPNQTRI